MVQQIIKAIDANQSIPKLNILDFTKMFTICSEDVTEETVKNFFINSRISPEDQANAENVLDDQIIKLRINMEKLKSLGVDEIP